MKPCPDCSDTLSDEAKRCACGWVHPDLKASEAKADNQRPALRCRFQSGKLRCKFPASSFDGKEKNGCCTLHHLFREDLDKSVELLEWSQTATKDDYRVRVEEMVATTAQPAWIKAMQAEVERRAKVRREIEGARSVGALLEGQLR